MPSPLQAGVSEFAVPHVGDPAAGSRDRLAGDERHRVDSRQTGVQTAAGKVLLQENPVEESVRAPRELRDHHCQN